MKNIIYLLFLLGNFKNVLSQNLVPNPGFETINACTWQLLNSGEAHGNAPPWNSPTTGGNCDLFNTCCTFFASSNGYPYGVPANNFGYQAPHSGNGYAGGQTYFSGMFVFHEYLQIPLSSPLVAGEQYCASFYVNASCSSYSNLASNNIGMYFSDTLTNIPNYYSGVLNFVPQLNTTALVTDTTNWTLISGQFIAQGGEQYIIIGNFYSDSLTDTIQILPGASANANSSAYYYYDDIDVHCCSCGQVGIKESEIKYSDFIVYPNPVTDKLNIQLNNDGSSEIILYDLLSRKLLQQTFTNSTTINTEQLAKGMYLYEVRNKNGIIRNGKVIKQ